MNILPTQPPLKILRLEDVKKKTGLSRSSIYRLEDQGTFPCRVILTVGSVGWYEHEVNEFLAARPRAIPASKNTQSTPYQVLVSGRIKRKELL